MVKRKPYSVKFRGGSMHRKRLKLPILGKQYEALTMDDEGYIWKETYAYTIGVDKGKPSILASLTSKEKYK